MIERPAHPQPLPPATDRRPAILGGIALAVLALVALALVGLVVLARNGSLPGVAAAPATPGGYAIADPKPAPPLELTDQDGRPFSLAALRGRPVLVFFGYTHCPDVCPATVGTLNEALRTAPAGARVAFVSIDPDRDDVAAMKQYVRYLPTAYSGLTGSPETVRRNADPWGVKYAKVDQGSADGYAMAHTADVYLVDAQGRLRARFPFGTQAAPIAAALTLLLAETTPPSDAPAPSPASSGGAAVTPPPATASRTAGASAPAPTLAPMGPMAPGSGGLEVSLVSSSVWAGGASPVIVTLTDTMGMGIDPATAVTARVIATDGTPGPDVPAVAIRPPGVDQVSYVATLDIPSAGSWRIDLTTATGETGSVTVDALDPGTTAALGAPAPDARTPTVDDVGGLALAVTTVPDPDLRLSETSTVDARAAGRPYVLVVDSARFKVSPACGRALAMVRFLVDRWTDVSFIHLEPFEYSIITSEPVLNGELADPPVNRVARAWGLGDATWPGVKMPWIFVVDGSGIVRAKYTGIVGSADVDVMLSLITGEGLVPGS